MRHDQPLTCVAALATSSYHDRTAAAGGAVIDRQFAATDVFIYCPVSGIDARYRSRFEMRT
jgi:hypothetical protein